MLQLKQAQRDAELQAAQAAVLQERARKRAAAAKRDAEKSVAVKNRVVERQREVRTYTIFPFVCHEGHRAEGKTCCMVH